MSGILFTYESSVGQNETGSQGLHGFTVAFAARKNQGKMQDTSAGVVIFLYFMGCWFHRQGIPKQQFMIRVQQKYGRTHCIGPSIGISRIDVLESWDIWYRWKPVPCNPDHTEPNAWSLSEANGASGSKSRKQGFPTSCHLTLHKVSWLLGAYEKVMTTK